MINIQNKQLCARLDALNLDAWARKCRVDTGYTKKIRGRDLLQGFLLMHAQQGASLEDWAGCIEGFSGRPVSKQALFQRCTEKHVRFFERVCTEALQQRVGPEADAVGPALRSFRHVFVEDSTCIGLDRSLSEAFPSSYTKGADAATARLQLRVDLQQERITDFHIGSYRDNDQSYSRNILTEAGPGDLVIRDMGYFSLPTFQALADQGSFFLSRLRYGVVLSDRETGRRIELLEKGGLLTTGDPTRDTIDLKVQIGAKTPVPVRLIGRRVPEEVAAERRRKAKSDRHGRANHGAEYLRWLDWNFFVTNVGLKRWTAETASAVYRLRWRIEVVFKTLKSCFRAATQLEKRRMSACRVRLTILGWLIYSALVLEPTYRYFAAQLSPRGKALSLLKYGRWLRIHYVEMLLEESLASFTDRVARHCVYEVRHDRSSYNDHRSSVGKQQTTPTFP